MRLRPGGIDVFYIDESHDQTSYVMTAVTMPFLRSDDRGWLIAWPDCLAAAKRWRKEIKNNLNIPTTKELHGNKLIYGRGKYLRGRFNFDKPKASSVYRQILNHLDIVVPEASIISAAARLGSTQLYGRTRLEACLYALLQRMRLQCEARHTNALVFFDQGHPEYRKLYRQAQVWLPTGSSMGGWAQGGSTKNLALDMFTKDGNEKDSRHCFFTQIADLVAYSAFLKIKGQFGELEPWQAKYNLGTLYDEIPATLVNTRASRLAPRDGIVRLF